MNDLNDLECDMNFGNDINFHTPKKQNESSQYKTPEQNFQDISRLKDSYRFLSPATNHYMRVLKRQAKNQSLNTMLDN